MFLYDQVDERPAGLYPAESEPSGQAQRLACALVTEWPEVERLAPTWSALLERSYNNHPMLSPAWLLPWWRIYGDGRALRVGLFHDGDRLVGLAPLHRRRVWARRCLPFRRLEQLGADVAEGDGVGSEYLGVLAERGSEAAVAQAVVTAITAGRFGPLDEVVLPVMAGDRPLPSLLTSAFARAGFHAECATTGACPNIPLPTSWDEYLAALSGNARYFVRRSLRDFEKWAGGPPLVRRATTAAELAEGTRILKSLHGDRWAKASQSGVFYAPRFAAFHDAVMPDLLRQGALQLWWLMAHGEPIAALYNIVWDGRVLVYQSGRKPDTPPGIRPGIVLHALAIRAAVEAGQREYDFLGGEAQYKSQMSLASRPLVQVRAARRCLVEAGRRLIEGTIALTRPARRTADLVWQRLRNRAAN